MKGRWRVFAGLAALGLLGVGAWEVGGAALPYVEAAVGQRSAAASWKRPADAAATGHRVVARLRVPARGVELYVYAGTGRESLARGPGHFDTTPLPGEPGVSILAGHRETHFAFLRHLATGDMIEVERRGGARHRFQVAAAYVVDGRRTGVAAGARGSRLALVTCYPFERDREPGPLRYVVFAEKTDTPSRKEPHGSPSAERAGRRSTEAGL